MLVTQRSPQLPPACQAWPWRGTVIYGSLSPGSYAATARWQKRRGAAGSADLAEGPVQPRRRGRAKGRGPWRGRGVVDAVGAGGGEAVRVVHRKEAVRVEGRAALVFAGGAQHGAAARLVHLHRLPPTHPTRVRDQGAWGRRRARRSGSRTGSFRAAKPPQLALMCLEVGREAGLTGNLYRRHTSFADAPACPRPHALVTPLGLTPAYALPTAASHHRRPRPSPRVARPPALTRPASAPAIPSRPISPRIAP